MARLLNRYLICDPNPERAAGLSILIDRFDPNLALTVVTDGNDGLRAVEVFSFDLALVAREACGAGLLLRTLAHRQPGCLRLLIGAGQAVEGGLAQGHLALGGPQAEALAGLRHALEAQHFSRSAG